MEQLCRTREAIAVCRSPTPRCRGGLPSHDARWETLRNGFAMAASLEGFLPSDYVEQPGAYSVMIEVSHSDGTGCTTHRRERVLSNRVANKARQRLRISGRRLVSANMAAGGRLNA